MNKILIGIVLIIAGLATIAMDVGYIWVGAIGSGVYLLIRGTIQQLDADYDKKVYKGLLDDFEKINQLLKEGKDISEISDIYLKENNIQPIYTIRLIALYLKTCIEKNDESRKEFALRYLKSHKLLPDGKPEQCIDKFNFDTRIHLLDEMVVMYTEQPVNLLWLKGNYSIHHGNLAVDVNYTPPVKMKGTLILDRDYLYYFSDEQKNDNGYLLEKVFEFTGEKLPFGGIGMTGYNTFKGLAETSLIGFDEARISTLKSRFEWEGSRAVALSKIKEIELQSDNSSDSVYLKITYLYRNKPVMLWLGTEKSDQAVWSKVWCNNIILACIACGNILPETSTD